MRALFVVISFFIVFSIGCTSPSKNSCSQQDWYEIGRTDGAKGQQEINLSKQFRACSQGDKHKAMDLYNNGRNLGLAMYCRPHNALELGKLAQPYKFVCPAELEQEFLNSYKKGRKIRRITIKNTRLENEINQYKKKINRSNDHSLILEIKNRQKQINKNKNQLNRLSLLFK